MIDEPTGEARPRIRVLWLIKGLGPGGAERLLVEQAARSDRGALEYDVAYLLSWKGHLEPELEALGVAVHCLEARSAADPRWPVRLRRLVHDRDIDVVHIHSPALAGLARPVLRTLRRRPAIVYTEHNGWPSYRLPTRLANRLTLGLDDVTLAVSDAVRASMGRHGRDVEVVVHGIDVDRVRAHLADRDTVRAELGVAARETLVVTVANLRTGKGYPDLLTAAHAVIDDGPALRFAAAGQGPQEAELEALHDRLGLGDRFRLLGYVPDAARLIAAADLFVLASVHEGLPVAVMEALALGVPVVATRVGGLPELIEPGESGLLVEPGDPDALAEAIRAAVEPATRARLAAGARRRGATVDAGPAVSRLDRLYLDLARSRARAS
jgi:glycosyltransferase involved in cell wall biosynthesis